MLCLIPFMGVGLPIRNIPLGQPVSCSGCLVSPYSHLPFSGLPETFLWGFSFCFLKSADISVLWEEEQPQPFLDPPLLFLLRNFGFTLMLLEIPFSTV